MPYSYISLGQAKSQLAARLDSQFWSDTELGLYIIEALRTWNALANFWRAEFVFNTIINTSWYDISDAAVAPNTLRPQTITDVELYTMMQYHLLEPPTGATWTGSFQYTADDLMNAVQKCRDQVISATTCHVIRRVVNAPLGRVFLPDSVIDIRRVAWLPVAGFGFTNSPLWPDDQWAIQAFERDYTTRTPGIPTTYRQSTAPPLSFDVDVSPAIPGDYEVISVDGGVALSLLAPTVLTVPDDFAWVIKWGALAELYGSEANKKDALREQYCLMRYKQGMAALLNSPAVLAARVNNIPIDVDSVQNTDNYRPNWQAETTAAPDVAIVAGLNMVGVAPLPDAVYAMTLSVVRNAPVPIVGADQDIQIGKDILKVILGYAQHLASLKMGGFEFIASIPMLDEFHKQAAMYNSKLMEMGEFSHPTYELSGLQSESNPVFNTVNYTPGEG